MSDFGLDAQLTTCCAGIHATCGTSYYMGPEVFDRKPQFKSDVWSLGISLLELAEGVHPYADCNEFEVGVVRGMLMSR